MIRFVIINESDTPVMNFTNGVIFVLVFFTKERANSYMLTLPQNLTEWQILEIKDFLNLETMLETYRPSGFPIAHRYMS